VKIQAVGLASHWINSIAPRSLLSFTSIYHIFDPLHYLALIEQKANALDQAAPLAD
jgi:hypothetical protein